RQIQAVAHHRRESHPVLTSLADSIAIEMVMTDIGALGNSTTMLLMEKKAAAPARAIVAVYATTSIPSVSVIGAGMATCGVTAGGITGTVTGGVTLPVTAAPRSDMRLARYRRWRSAAVGSFALERSSVTFMSAVILLFRSCPRSAPGWHARPAPQA